MFSKKLCYMMTLAALVILPIVGCSGGGSSLGPAQTTQKGVQLTVSGKVNDIVAKSTAKTTGLTAIALNTVEVSDAQTGTSLGTTAIAADGTFSGLSFTLPAVKTILVFKATVSQGTYINVVPIDLSNPPAAGTISGNNSITITISPDTTAIGRTVSAMLGLSGDLGDPGMTLNSVGKTYNDAAQLVIDSGGKVLAYNQEGLNLIGDVSPAAQALLPATPAGTLSYSDLNDIKLEAKIISAFIPSNKPIVNFQVTNKATGKGISGLRTFGLHIAKLVPETTDGNSSYWVNYIDAGIAIPAGSGTGATAATKPSADPGTSYNSNGTVKVNGYTVIDHGDGTYTVVFASDVTSNPSAAYVATATHRVGVTVTTVAVPGVTATGPINPATGAASPTFLNVNRVAEVYDFTPSTGKVLADTAGKAIFARDIVSKGACDGCHNNLSALDNHFARWNPRLCVICHTATNTSGEGEFVTFIHRIHMGANLPAAVQPESVVNPSKPGARTTTLLPYATMKFPQDIRNCTVCHKGADADNWKTKPNMKNCGSCHNATVFATHQGGQTNNQYCAGCHAGISAIAEVSAKHVLPAAADPALRILNPSIKAAAVDAATGKVTVTFTVDNNGTAVTDPALIPAATFILAKLMPAANGTSSYWQSMLVQYRTKDGAKKPVLQGTGESRQFSTNATATTAPGTLVYDSAKAAFVYTYALEYVTTPGDIRGGVTQAPIKRSNAPYVNNTMVALPAAISYNPAATYRVGLEFTGNKTNPVFDFVPDGVTAKQSRAIVSMAACQKCHAGTALHNRYNVDYCVACHSLNSFDPFSGDPNGGDVNSGTGGSNLAPVNLQTIIHKIHMGIKLPSVVAGGTYMINGENFSTAVYPAALTNCATCHVEGTGAPANSANWYTTPTKEACMGCHDGVATQASHNSYTNQSCISCHGSNRKSDVKSAHRWW